MSIDTIINLLGINVPTITVFPLIVLFTGFWLLRIAFTGKGAGTGFFSKSFVVLCFLASAYLILGSGVVQVFASSLFN